MFASLRSRFDARHPSRNRTVQHGTTLRRARLIEACGPDPHFRKPGGGHIPRAEAFSMCIAGATYSATGLPVQYARDKSNNFRDEGGPAILEVVVPGWIMNLLYADREATFMAAGGEFRFEPASGLNELRAEWPNLTKRVLPL